MNRGLRFYITFAVILAIFWYVSSLADTQEHEAIHADIFEDYGIEVKEVKIYSNPIKALLEGKAGYTSVASDEYYEKCNDSCKMLHNQVEIASYENNTTRGMMFGIMFFAILIISVLLPEDD